MAKMIEKVTATSKGMKTVGISKNHQIIIDEPQQMGGQDEGANPLGTLLISLAGCENVIDNMVAREIQFDLQEINFDVKGELDPAGMMGTEGVLPYFQTITVNAKVKTSESEDRIKELQEIVDSRCPVFTALKAANIEMVPNWSKE
ncbi:OsmC family protein [Bacillaceae bacterium S4-13-58]